MATISLGSLESLGRDVQFKCWFIIPGVPS
jgi:hypothetical protein